MKSAYFFLMLFFSVGIYAQQSPNSENIVPDKKLKTSFLTANQSFNLENDSIAKRNANLIARELSEIPTWELPLRNTSPIQKNVRHTLQQDKNFNYLNDGIVDVLTGTQSNTPNDLTIGFPVGKNKK